MSMRIRLLVSTVAAAGLLFAADVALAARVVSVAVTGQVTAVSGASSSITIDGRTYQAAPGSPAASAISAVQPGERVDLTLDGPPTAPGTHVVAISPHQGS